MKNTETRELPIVWVDTLPSSRHPLYHRSDRGVFFGEMMDGSYAVQIEGETCVRAFHTSKVRRI